MGWNNSLILTFDPNIQRDIQGSDMSPQFFNQTKESEWTTFPSAKLHLSYISWTKTYRKSGWLRFSAATKDRIFRCYRGPTPIIVCYRGIGAHPAVIDSYKYLYVMVSPRQGPVDLALAKYAASCPCGFTLEVSGTSTSGTNLHPGKKRYQLHFSQKT